MVPSAAELANLRAAAALPGALRVTVRGPAGTVTIPRENIVGKSDDELLRFIAERLAEQQNK
jgi:hypothetical protein